MTSLLIFLLGTAFFGWVSRNALLKPRSHGFYRFFAWECILGLVVLNFPMWHTDPFAPHQLVSWGLLIASPVMAIEAVRLLRRVGRPSEVRADAELYSFEKTSTLVTTGIYRHIRHPMYAALLFLAWGAFLKDASPAGVVLVLVASTMLLLTARRDEVECGEHFGAAYAEYMRGTKRFIPYVF